MEAWLVAIGAAVVAATLTVGVPWLVLSVVRDQIRRLQEENREKSAEIRRLIDRLTTYKIAEADPSIANFVARMPPSLREDLIASRVGTPSAAAAKGQEAPAPGAGGQEKRVAQRVMMG